MSLPRIDFEALAADLVARANVLLPMWLPGGVFRGHEYVCAGLGGGNGGSLSVNTSTGRWADFASEDKGGDLVSLYAAVKGLSQLEAAKELRGEASSVAAAPVVARPAKEPALKSDWRPVVPVPHEAPAPTFAHWQFSPENGYPTRKEWAYFKDGELLGYVVRYDKADGGKEVLPYTWCSNVIDTARTTKWHHKQWADPRPLYLANGHSPSPGDTVVLVEGEKCADAGQNLGPIGFDFVSWSGGCKAWQKADWTWLQGCKVVLWPDADAKRVPLTKNEREAALDPASKPYLSKHEQPGYKAMAGIGAKLQELGCTVSMCPVSEPGAVPDGWDIADAIDSGWGPNDVLAYIRGARPLAVAQSVDGASTLTSAGAGGGQGKGGKRGGQGDDEVTWRTHLLRTDKGAIKPVRENVVLALDGLGELPGDERLADLIGFNEFSNQIIKHRATPWGTPAGAWQENDELAMGEWLVHSLYLPSMARQTLEEAAQIVAWRHKYHPVREHLKSIRVWDGVRRLHRWIMIVCMATPPEAGSQECMYLERVGTWFFMGMCQRILQPGCKFDYMLVLEGAQGVGKSTLAKTLGGEWFADTGLVLGDKDSYQNLQSIWVYEIGEMDAFSKAEITKIKSFISSEKDRFRASFDRRPRDYPRQCVFIGTTNEDHYLTDPTGNRRFWPVCVTKQVDIAWLRENRDQLFAEAMHLLAQGERFNPTPAESRKLFEPIQEARTVESAIGAQIADYLHNENRKPPMNGEAGCLIEKIGLVPLLSAIGITMDRLGPGRFHEKQAAAALRKLGWVEKRSSEPGRPRLYHRPPKVEQVPSAAPALSIEGDARPANEAGDDEPF